MEALPVPTTVPEAVFTLAWPPSLNRLYRNVRGRTLLSREGRAWKAQAAWELAVQRQGGRLWPMEQSLALVVEVFPPDRRRFDIDNRLKAVLDAGNGVLWVDDTQIDDLRIVRRSVRTLGQVRITVKPLLGIPGYVGAGGDCASDGGRR